MRRALFAASVLAVAAGAWLLAPRAGTVDLAQASAAPSAAFWLGTDALGRDVLARVIVAAPLSIALALGAVLIALVAGVPIGGVSALGNARWRDTSARAIEIVMTFPSMLLALVIVMLLGPGGASATVAVGLAMAPGFARTAQSLAMAVANSEYLAAAKVLGLSPQRRLVRYVLPNIAGPLGIKAAFETGQALVIIAGFSFLGFGVQAPGYDWGRMLAQGMKALYISPLPALAPGFAITLAGLCFNLLSDRLLEPARATPRTKARMAPFAIDGHVTAAAPGAVLSIRDLQIGYGDTQILHGIDLDLAHGEALGIVGESGSGKTTLALAIAGLLPASATVHAERITLAGAPIEAQGGMGRSPLLGEKTGFVFQDALSAFNPLISIGRQLAERVEVYRAASPRAAWADSVAALGEVGIVDPAQRARQRRHQLSGGMRQRALIAMGLITRPVLLIADEPTTALDVTIQAQVLDVLRAATQEKGTAILFVSHDLAVVATLCTRVVVLYAGRIVEIMPAAALAAGGAMHPYTRALIAALPGETVGGRLATIPGAVTTQDVNRQVCAFAPRCARVQQACLAGVPALAPIGIDQQVACVFPVVTA